MLDVQPPQFRQDNLDFNQLAPLLGLESADLKAAWPTETAVGDFKHLVVPTPNLATMQSIQPDFSTMVRFCHAYDIETIVAFCTETEGAGYDLHVRDFCPAVGVAESAAAGTTNAALTSYLIRHGIVKPNREGRVIVQAEQGHEINRPSTIRSSVSMADNGIVRLQVGGVATRVLGGILEI